MKEEIVAVLRGAGANKEGELCVQAIFLLLDVLKKWAEDAKGTAAFSSSGTTAQPVAKIHYGSGPIACCSGKALKFAAVVMLITEPADLG